MAINPEDPIYIEKRDSCTKDEVVAKLFGWMRSPIRLLCFQIDEYGCVLAEHLPVMHSLDQSIMDFLEGQHKCARIAFLDAVEGDATLAEIQEKEAAVSAWLQRVTAALGYLRAIDKELAKGKDSMLTVDHVATDETGELHLTLESVHWWATATYGIPTIDEEIASAQSLQPATATPKKGDAAQASAKTPRHRAQEKAILDAIVEHGLDPKCLPRNEPGKCGVKFIVRNALKGNPLFAGTTIYDKAWDRLLIFRDIVLK